MEEAEWAVRPAGSFIREALMSGYFNVKTGHLITSKGETFLSTESGDVGELLKLRQKLAVLEHPYRRSLYDILSDIYAVGIQLISNEDRSASFYGQSYFEKEVTRQTSDSIRDIFRDCCKFVLNAATPGERKSASKYGSVLSSLYRIRIRPEYAAQVIEEYGGVEQIAQKPLSERLLFDPRDVGDGMTATGELIIYPDVERASLKRRLRLKIEGKKLIFDQMPNEGWHTKTFKIVAVCDSMETGTSLRFIDVSEVSE